MSLIPPNQIVSVSVMDEASRRARDMYVSISGDGQQTNPREARIIHLSTVHRFNFIGESVIWRPDECGPRDPVTRQPLHALKVLIEVYEHADGPLVGRRITKETIMEIKPL